MPPIVLLAVGAFAAGAIIHRLIKEYGVNAEIDRVETGRAIDPVNQDGVSLKKQRALKAG
jgi:hypothetical protein